MSKAIIYDNEKVISAVTSLESIEPNMKACDNADERFFWLEGKHRLYSVDGEYRLGIVCKQNRLCSIELFRVDGYDETLDADLDQKRYRELEQCLLDSGFTNVDIHYSFNLKDRYGSLIVYV